ncbi:histidine kinase N-terminal 7TM domain-containing protein [Spirochaeta dissipatitropha]
MPSAIDYHLFLIIAPFALGSTLLAISSIAPYRSKQVARSLIWYLLMVSFFLAANTVELIANTEIITISAAKVSHMFFLGSGLAWLAFGFCFAGFPHLGTWKTLRWFTILPVIIVIVIWTNEYHLQFWVNVGATRIGNYTVLRPVYGPWFWIYGIYLYFLLIGGVVLMVSVTAASRHAIQRQTVLISLGAFIPILFNLLYVFRLLPSIRKDYTPVAFALAGVLFFLAVHRYSLMRILPVNRHFILEDVHSAVLVLDEYGHVQDVNNYAQVLLDIDPVQIIDSHISSCSTLNGLLESVPLNERSNFETSRVKNTELQHLDIWIQPLVDKNGRHAGTTVTIHDVSSWNRLLQERNNAISTLQSERMRLLELQIMLQKQERLSTIGQLAANMAHEISNPLSFIISGIKQLELQEESKDQATTDIYSDIHEGLERISASIQSLLHYSRGMHTAKEFNKTVLADIVRKSAALTSPAIGRVHMEIQVPPEIELYCIESELSQVLVNLLLNAAHAIEKSDYASDTHPWIRISAWKQEGTIFCSVSDSGTGIPEEDREKIFEAFYSSKKAGEGTGLGLSISRHIVQNHHKGKLYLAGCQPTEFILEIPEDHHTPSRALS